MKEKLIKKIFCLLAFVGVIFGLVTVNSSAITISDTVIDDGDHIYGYYNKYVHWSITRSTEKMNVVGNGDFYYTHHIEPYKDYIKHLTIGSGIISIQDDALANISFEIIGLSDTLKSIGNRAFSNCKYVKKLVIPASVEYIGKGAFEGCDSLTHIYIYSENIVVDEGAFPDSLDLKHVYFYGENIDVKSGNEEFSKLVGDSKNTSLLAMIFACFICVIIILFFVFYRKSWLKTKNMKGEGCCQIEK